MPRGKIKKKRASIDALMDIPDDEPTQWADPYEGLNDAQRSVVAWNEGAVIVVAVPGSGKTRSIVNRMYRMHQDGIDMSRVLATTFTKRGAGEMNDRLKSLGCPVGEGGAEVGTFHHVCLSVIRDGSPWKDYEVDADNKMRYALKDVLGYRQMNWRGADISEVEGFIGACKNGLVGPRDVKVDRGAKPYDAQRPGVTNDPRMGEAYFLYEEERERRGLITFDDMLKLSVEYLRADSDTRARWEGRYDHVIVDEFQDTNLAQHALMEILATGSKSLMAVGDARQLIFGWRGSVLDLTLNFREKFMAEVIEMSINYRCLPGIIDVANRTGSTFPHDVMKSSAVANREGEASVDFQRAADMDDEAVRVVERAVQLHEDGVRWGEMAVMYRTNAQSRSFEEECIRRQVPHVVIGGTDFYRRKEVADLLAYLRLAVDPTDDASCRRAINRPFRFIGRVSVDAMEDEAAGSGQSMLDVARECRPGLGLKPRQISSVIQFVEIVDALRADLADKQTDLPSAFTGLLRRTRYEEWIVGDEGTDTAENSRLSNIRELVRTSGRFKTAEAMLKYIDNLADERKKRKKGNADLMQLSTVHKQKGLEFGAVFVAGCAESILPHGRSDDIEEEKRIFYVAITRAKDHLMITCPTSALVGGKTVELRPSRFVVEAGLVDRAEKINILGHGPVDFNDYMETASDDFINKHE